MIETDRVSDLANDTQQGEGISTHKPRRYQVTKMGLITKRVSKRLCKEAGVVTE